MKKLFSAMLVAALTFSVGMSTVEAKRMGGGSSIGKQSQSVNRQALPPTNNQAATAAKPSTPAAAAPKPASPWRGILGGALLGLGLGALLSHLGIGGALASIISTVLMVALLALAAMFIYRMIKRKSQPTDPMRPAYAGAGAGMEKTSSTFETPAIGSRVGSAQPAAFQDASVTNATAAPYVPTGVPADFDSAGFLRHAKTHFIRLQAAWDRADVSDIREFTTPEMFAELKMQLQERGNSANHTDVVSLEADLLGMETVGQDYVASVRFSGMIKESEHAAAEPFQEAWNLTKPVNGQGGWLLAGIQQLN